MTLDSDGNGTIGMEEFYKYVMGLSPDAIHRAGIEEGRKARCEGGYVHGMCLCGVYVGQREEVFTVRVFQSSFV